MRIGIDLSVARINQAGTGVYARCLFDALRALGTSEEWVPFAVNQQRDMSAEKTLHSRLDTLHRDLVWTHLILPWLAYRARVDLLHMPANVLPMFAPCRGVVTILDTTVLQYPGSFPIWQRNYLRVFVPLAAKKAARILTISDHSKGDIINHLGVEAEKVTVTYLAALPVFRVLGKEKVYDVVSKHNLGGFVLTVGTLEPRKNMIGLLRAFARLRQLGHTCHLVHAGPRGWMYEAALQEVDRLGLGESVRFLGRVALEELVQLYNAATMLVYPSYYEGFGLPVLEAMACGCPVITSNRSSLPEIAGGAAVIVDPEDVEGLALAMKRLLEDRALSHEMRTRGLRRATEFSWERCARQTLSAYREALEG